MEIDLEFVYGYNGTGTHNVDFNRMGELIYHVGVVAIVLNREKMTQRFYTGHKGCSITCINIHPDGELVTSGQVCNVVDDPRPTIRRAGEMEKFMSGAPSPLKFYSGWR